MTPIGKLYVIATPIGNLGDICERAKGILQQVDWVAAEDTRHSTKLFNQLNVTPKMIPYHEHNERVMMPRLVDKLQRGEVGALLSDAGTPLISDPGFLLVQALHDKNIPVSPIPGPCAAIAALSVSGLRPDKFSFLGFLPPKTLKRQAKLQALETFPETMIFYESPHRLQACLEDMLAVFGPDRKMTLARELTKMYEQVVTNTIQVILDAVIEGTIPVKGEMVIVVSGKASQEKVQGVDEGVHPTLQVLLKHLPLKQAVEIATELTGEKKNKLYQTALAFVDKNRKDPD